MDSQLESSPVAAMKSKEKMSSPLEATTKADKSGRISKKRPSEEGTGLGHLESTPVPATKDNTKTNSVRKVTPGDVSLTPSSEPNTSEKSIRLSKKRPSEEVRCLEQMTSQLESTPVPVTKSKKNAPSEPTAKATKFCRLSKKRPSEEGPALKQMDSQLECTPIPATKSKENFPSEPTIKVNKSGHPSKKRPSEEGSGLKQMDSQLESAPVLATKSKKNAPSEPTIKVNKSGRPSKNCPSEEGSGLEQMDSQLDSQLECTPFPATKSKKNAPSELKSGRPSTKRPSEEGSGLEQLESTPLHATKGSKKTNSVRKVTPRDLSLTPFEPNTKLDRSGRPSKKRPPNDGPGLEQMVSQLESIVRRYNQEPTHPPKRSKPDDEKLNSSNNDLPTKKQRTMQVKQDVVVDRKPENVEKPGPSSPKRRGKRITQSPTKSSPKSSPTKDVAPESQTAPESNDRNVGFLGMTIVDNKTETRLPESCYQPRERPLLLVEQLPNSTIVSRLADAPTTIPSSFSAEVTTTTTESVHFKRHSDERQTLSARHRAEHEMVRKKVLHSIRYVLSTWDMQLDSTMSHGSIVDSAKSWFDEALMGHQEMLSDMLDRQMLEAESLAARQTSELPDKCAPLLQVSFPFPEVFKQARQEMISMLQ